MKRIIACTLAIIAFLFAVGQERTDSVKVYFHISQWDFDPTLDSNAASMDSFIEKVAAAAKAQNLESIDISAYASPEGSDRLNNQLAAERCATIASIIVNRTGINPEIIRTHPVGVAWAELRSMITDTPEVPARAQILEIIDNTPIWVFNSKGKIISSRKKQLMDLRGGRPWQWMSEHLFPALRNSVAISFSQAAPADTAAAEIAESPEAAESPEIAEIANIANVANVAIPEEEVEPQTEPRKPRHLLALKTNALYYAALLPNLELEWLINDNWSVALEGNVAWWGHYRDNKSYRLALLDAEARRWIKPRAPWHGMYAGVIAGGGWYDLLNGTHGYYGEGLMTGLSFGYMWPITRSLSLEAEAGVGYMFTRYKEYETIGSHHVYQRTKDLNYFGPIKLKFSIVWRLFDINKNKRKATAL